MKFLAVAAAFVATAAATPAPGTGYTGSSGWGYPGWGGRWGGGWGGGYGGGLGGWGGDTNFQHGSNVCGSGNAVMCCNSATYEHEFGSDNAMFSLMDGFPHRGLPGSGVYNQCNNMNLGCKNLTRTSRMICANLP